MNNKAIGWIIGIVIVVGLIYWAYTKNKLGFIGIQKVVSNPGEESHCNEEEARLEGETCPQPMTEPLYLVVGGVKERSWTEKTLGYALEPNQNREDATTIKYVGSPYKWTYNQTRWGNHPDSPSYNSQFPLTEDKYYFVNNTKYPNYSGS